MIWNGSVFFDLNTIIANAGETGKATRIELELDNTLTTASEAATNAFIGKKDIDGIGIGIMINPVPEPSAFLLFGAGLAASAAATRRRNQRS